MQRIRFHIIIFFLLTILVASASGSYAAIASCGEGSRRSTRLADDTLKKIALMPDREISLSGTLFLISARASVDFYCRDADGSLVEKELDRISRRVRAVAGGFGDAAKTVYALNHVLFGEEGFVYEHVKGSPEVYLLDSVLARKRGNCLGITSVYLAIAERLDLPLGGVYVPSHCFVRYEGNGARINIETGEEGAERKDEWYERKFRLKEGNPYLRTMGRRQVIGMYLKTLGAAYSATGRDREALRLYGEAALFSPELPDAYYNAGVSYQKLGKTEDAVANYRKALALDPDMASARGNLASALCGCGREEEGIREYLKTLEIDPRNAFAHSGLAKAYYARGDYLQAARHCDRAMEQGCRFEPSMLEVLGRYRKPQGEISSGP